MMDKQLIYREDALEIVRRTSGDYAAAFAVISRLPAVEIESIPAADVTEVVYCRDCKYRRKNDENEPYCIAEDGLSDPSDDKFCSYGERK